MPAELAIWGGFNIRVPYALGSYDRSAGWENIITEGELLLLNAGPVFDLPAAIMMNRPGRRRFHRIPSIVV